MKENRIILQTSNWKRAEQYEAIFAYYGVPFESTKKDVWHASAYAKTIYGYCVKVGKSVERMILHDVKQLSVPPTLRRRNAYGSDYIRRV